MSRAAGIRKSTVVKTLDSIDESTIMDSSEVLTPSSPKTPGSPGTTFVGNSVNPSDSVMTMTPLSPALKACVTSVLASSANNSVIRTAGNTSSSAPVIVHILPLDEGAFLLLDNRTTLPEELPAYARGKTHNRYTNVLPNPITQVRLSIQHNDLETEYINANYIRGFGHRQARAYIAAQAPTTATLRAFVRMIWESGCVAIVMLTGLVELGKSKCAAYFPVESDDATPAVFGPVTVEVVRRSPAAQTGWMVSTLQLRMGSETRKVQHYWCKSWPDHDVPVDTQGHSVLSDTISMLRTIRDHHDMHGNDAPLLVHCSAGVGRTGTFISMDQARPHLCLESILPCRPQPFSPLHCQNSFRTYGLLLLLSLCFLPPFLWPSIPL